MKKCLQKILKYILNIQIIVSNSKLGMSFKSKLSENFIFFSEGESHVLKGDISKTGVHKQCGISVTTPQLLTKCVTQILARSVLPI